MGDVASEGLAFPQGRQKKQAEGRWYMHPHTVLVCVSVWLLIFQAVLIFVFSFKMISRSECLSLPFWVKRTGALIHYLNG